MIDGLVVLHEPVVSWYMLRYVRRFGLVWIILHTPCSRFSSMNIKRGKTKTNLKKRSKEEKNVFSTKIVEPNQWKRLIFLLKKKQF